MKKYVVEITISAHKDIGNIYTYLAEATDDKFYANGIIAKIYRSIEKVIVFPRSNRRIDDELDLSTEMRRILIQKRYVAFYQIKNNVIIIQRIVDGRRDYKELLGL
ncbi:type II toxin-antitoxin system RelE/ParE family toxin [Candidatus Saccharibacteria bacterium]|nr:type II toxin-antitoxin system RelE/ParE family toxin [Candidatus Saccharibacteria bacterium]MCL1963011.1 type II toxin-antitoxin system RelE/ParE family toxin [Candidatus Saccharibacteria bacterium]